VGLSFNDTSSADRWAGYRDALRSSGLPYDPTIVRAGDVDRGQGGYRMVRDLLEHDSRPDAILIANSRLALSGLRAIEEAGLDFPGQLGVAAFHDISGLDHYAPRLFRAVQQGYRMGQLATRRLLELTPGGNVPYREVILQPTIHTPTIQ